MIWYFVYMCEQTKLSPDFIMDMRIKTMLDYMLQLDTLFPKVETTKLTAEEIQKKYMHKTVELGGKNG